MSYVPAQFSLSMCQWSTAYNNAISRNCPHISYCDESSSPIIIEEGTSVVWDKLHMINRPIRVMPTATLTIKCEVRLSTNSYIEVRRGAKLIIDGGTLTNLCPGTWSGIQVWGNPLIAQPDPTGNNAIN